MLVASLQITSTLTEHFNWLLCEAIIKWNTYM